MICHGGSIKKPNKEALKKMEMKKALRGIITLIFLTFCNLLVCAEINEKIIEFSPKTETKTAQLERKFLFSEKTKDVIEEVEYSLIYNQDGSRIIINTSDESYTIDVDRLYRTKGCIVTSQTSGDTISIKRDENTITLSSKSSKKSFEVKPKPWYQSFLCLADFIKSPDKERSFYAIGIHFDEELTKGKPMKMVAIKEKTEIITLNNKEVKAVKIKFTFDDFRSRFWKAYYWYREQDGFLVMYKEKRGAPWTPPTVGMLIQEK